MNSFFRERKSKNVRMPGRSSLASADKGRQIVGPFVDFVYRESIQPGDDRLGGKRIARPDRIDDVDRRRDIKRMVVFGNRVDGFVVFEFHANGSRRNKFAPWTRTCRRWSTSE